LEKYDEREKKRSGKNLKKGGKSEESGEKEKN